MFGFAREIVAYGIMGVLAAGAIPWLALHAKRRHREKLRRRGDKRYGH